MDISVEQVLRDAASGAVPAVFRGLNSSWPALRKWKGAAGLQYLQSVAGHAEVQAMVSSSSEFFGDIEHHQEVGCTLGELLQQAQQQQQHNQQQVGHQDSRDDRDGGTKMHLYLAQQPMIGSVLTQLLQDTPTPSILNQKPLTSTNLWYSSNSSRSSLHYDPYENMLCVVTGSKTVCMYSPAAVLGLYPKPLGGEASNHSCVDFAWPNLQQHPLYKHVQSQAVEVTLQPGDALYIPEGWWHQVDSADMTFAVNFWWDSQLSLLLKSLPHMHHYYLRQLLNATTSEAVQLLLESIQPWQPNRRRQQQQQQQQRSPAGQQEEEPQQNQQQQQQQQSGEIAVADWPPSKRPRLATGSKDNSQQQQEQQQQGLEAAARLTEFELQALSVLTGPIAGSHAQQQQQQQQQREQQKQAPSVAVQLENAGHTVCTAAAAATAGGAGEEGPAGVRSSCSSQGTGLLTGEAWWVQQQTAQQQLLADAAAAAEGYGSFQPTWLTRPKPLPPPPPQQQQRVNHGDASCTNYVLGLTYPVSRVLAALQPQQLLRVLWEGSAQNPEAIGNLLLRRLSPAAAQLLTQGLEAADGLFADSSSSSIAAPAGAVADESQPAAATHGGAQDGAQDGGGAQHDIQQQQQQQPKSVVVPGGGTITRQEFYSKLYGTVPDPAGILRVLLVQKTQLAAAATDLVLKAQLGRL